MISNKQMILIDIGSRKFICIYWFLQVFCGTFNKCVRKSDVLYFSGLKMLLFVWLGIKCFYAHEVGLSYMCFLLSLRPQAEGEGGWFWGSALNSGFCFQTWQEGTKNHRWDEETGDHEGHGSSEVTGSSLRTYVTALLLKTLLLTHGDSKSDNSFLQFYPVAMMLCALWSIDWVPVDLVSFLFDVNAITNMLTLDISLCIVAKTTIIQRMDAVWYFQVKHS